MPIDSRSLHEGRSEDLDELRERLRERESELDEYRDLVRREQYEIQQKLEKEQSEKEKAFKRRESMLAHRQHEYQELLTKQEKENHELRLRLTREIREKEKSLNEALDELEREKSRFEKEARENIESTSQNYVSEALTTLKAKEDDFHTKSLRWAILGAISIGLGLLFFIVLSAYSTLYPPQSITWQNIALYTTKGLVVVGLFLAFAKYAYGYSAAYMHESLKNADRRHAINFGKFYLEAYGASAEWKEVKQAFEHWNISERNAFTKQEKSTASNSDTTLKTIEDGLKEVVSAIKNVTPSKNV